MGHLTSRSRLMAEGAWIAIGQIFAIAGTLFGIRVLTEFLPPHVYGAVTLLLGITALGLGMLFNPVMQAILRFYPEYSSNEILALRNIVTTILFRRTVLGTIILGFAWPIMHYVWGTPWTMIVFLPPLLILEGLRTLETVLLN